MIAFDATFLVDYLNGDRATADFLEDRADEPFYAPTQALFEVYRGAATSAGPDRVDRVTSSLDWIEPLPVTDGAAREAALVEAELVGDGNRITVGDVVIAGVCRHNGARLVTRDGDFEDVSGLQTVDY